MADKEVDVVKTGVQVLGEIMKAAGDSPDVKLAAANLGKTAVTVTKTINTCLLPLAALNFAVDKAKQYFNGPFQEHLGAKAASIPADHLVEPKASIAGPALQGLAFSHEEPDLKEMYLSLLANAMDGRVSGEVHPSFVEIVKQLSSDEARLLQWVYAAPLPILPILQIRRKDKHKPGFTTLQRHVLDLNTGPDKKPIVVPRLAAMVDNWIRLGLVTVDYDASFTAVEHYMWVDARPEVIKQGQSFDAEAFSLDLKRGVMSRTDFGVQFAGAVGLVALAG